jgi:fatty acid desaturase
LSATSLDARRSRTILLEIRREAEAAGLLEPSSRALALRAPLGLASLLTLLSLAWTAESQAVALVSGGLAGLACVQLGFIAHDAGHGSAGRSRFVNDLAGHLAFTILNGLGFQSWRVGHSAHHAFCQDESQDPDMVVDVVLSLTPASAAKKRGLGRWLLPFQAWYLWPAALLFAHSLRWQSLGRSYRRPGRYRADCLLLPLHYAGWLVLPVLVTGTGLGRSAAVYIACSSVMGVYLAVLFWVNHVGMPALPEGHSLTQLEQQVLGTRNVRHASWLDFFFGGLDFQIEHHLLPDLPSARLRELQSISRRHCRAAGLRYHEEGFGSALASVSRHVWKLSQRRS